MGRPRTNIGPCAVDGCNNAAKQRGWCRAHAHRFYRYGTPTGEPGPRRRTQPDVCTISECEKPTKARGWCAAHYHQWQKHGDPLVIVNDGRSLVTAQGYRRVYCPGHPTAMADGYALEHRKVWHDTNGPIPPGHEIHHVNHQRLDNRPENLKAIANGDHQALHARLRRAS